MNAKQKANSWSAFVGALIVLSVLFLLPPMGAEASHCKGVSFFFCNKSICNPLSINYINEKEMWLFHIY